MTTFTPRHVEVHTLPLAMETKLHVDVIKVFIWYKISDRNHKVFHNDCVIKPNLREVNQQYYIAKHN